MLCLLLKGKERRNDGLNEDEGGWDWIPYTYPPNLNLDLKKFSVLEGCFCINWDLMIVLFRFKD